MKKLFLELIIGLIKIQDLINIENGTVYFGKEMNFPDRSGLAKIYFLNFKKIKE